MAHGAGDNVDESTVRAKSVAVRISPAFRVIAAAQLQARRTQRQTPDGGPSECCEGQAGREAAKPDGAVAGMGLGADHLEGVERGPAIGTT